MRWIFLSLCFICSLQADPSKKICLNMIVKNESAVIRRSLTSAKPLIDYWVIVDTGSTDGTQAIIREVMKGIPGELHERPWVNFEVNRNQAMELSKSKGDYLLFIDADEEFVISDAAALAKLDQDCYLMKVHEQIDNSIDYTRALLVNNRLPWRWEGVLHELLECPTNPTPHLLEGIKVVSRSAEGARAKDPNKYLNDAAVLEEALKKDPNNSRYTFYLAQSYLNAKEYAKSLKNYQKRAKMGGFDEEVFISLYVSGHLQEKLGLLSELFIDSYWKAYHARPTRAEPLYRLADHYKRAGYPLMSYLLSSYALSIPFPSSDVLFTEPWVYEWGLLVNTGETGAVIGKNREALQALEAAITRPSLPEETRLAEEKNIQTLKERLR